MIRTVFRSEDLPPAERLAAFDAFLHTCEPPMRVTSAAPDRFRATARARDLGPLHILELTSSASVIRRTRRCDPAVCAVVFPLRGTLTVSQKGREALLRGQDFTFYDSSLPLRLGIAGPEPTTLLRVQVPRSLLPPPARHADRLAGTRLPAQEGLGALLTRFLADMAAEVCAYPAADETRLSAVALDLLAATLTHHLDGTLGPPPEPSACELPARIEAYVQEHLADPGLTPRTVAAAHHISVSYLHRLFRTGGTTVTELIRHGRLEGARRDLADRRLRETPVHRIAASWGFRDHSAFTRAFRTAYGVPPREYRETRTE
ncbi:helix-turn-helix domain-containing protein [Streptomyces sp. NRRL F-525]|uniref:AraC-like ligand-binding domain-containing protein n=1 Tax=Streptomyces sp. NRRL F-525 TaxID=1463861 RepID=UPI0005255024|nr:helix-turn-helix domain-containing protein [Streptomyces sp. NRRL F-525]